MNSRGMSLIELIVGLGVASMVAAIALTALSMAGAAVARKLAAVRADDSAWLALAAVARDLRGSEKWDGCEGSPTCTQRPSHRAHAALLLNHATWFAEDGLKRCPKDRRCDTYLEGITAIEFVARFPVADGRTLEVVLWTRDGGRYARTMRKPNHAK